MGLLLFLIASLIWEGRQAGRDGVSGRGSAQARTLLADAPSQPSAAPPAVLPRHYPHIRLAALAYDRTPMTAFEERRLEQSIDLVVCHPMYLRLLNRVAPQTPALLYTNTSNLYLQLLLDWLTFADEHGVSREEAFYHAARLTPFKGDSPSSRPVTWFWAVYRGGQLLTDVTDAACQRVRRTVRFADEGESLYLGYPERFREVHVQLAESASDGWAAALEYPTAVDRERRPTAWAQLRLLADTTERLTRSGQVAFDPPVDWKPARLNGSGPLFYVRFRTTAAGSPPAAHSLLGRDYVAARGTASGTIPVFDTQADADADGYLNDQEYAARAAGKDARFLYESRMVTPSYGPMRFATNPASTAFRRWAVEYHQQRLREAPLAGGFFMDNVAATAPIPATEVIEPVRDYPHEMAALMRGLAEAIAPRLVLMNTAGAGKRADPIIQANPAYLEEFALRPLAHHYAFFEDTADLVAHRAALTAPPPLAVLDSHPRGGSPTDARTQLATLAYYYLLADPDSTCLMFFGGFEPATSWKRHWCPAAAHDIGKPLAKWSLWASGTDPANEALKYRIYQRPYAGALVLYKPLSFGGWRGPAASLGDDTATTHDLKAEYRPLRADGTLGETVRRVTLRNGEGAILVKPVP
jgi:hypothetical protein